jgi:hypothetical protein
MIRHLGSGNQIDVAMIFARTDFVNVWGTCHQRWPVVVCIV